MTIEIKPGDVVRAVKCSTGEFHSAVKVLWIADNVIQTTHGVFATETLQNTVNSDVAIVDVMPALIRNRLCREVSDESKQN